MSRNRVTETKQSENKKKHIGIGLLVGGIFVSVPLAVICPILMGIGHIMIAVGILLLARRIARKKNGESHSETSREDKYTKRGTKENERIWGILSVIASLAHMISPVFLAIISSIAGIPSIVDIGYMVAILLSPPAGYVLSFIGKARCQAGTQARELCNAGAGISLIWIGILLFSLESIMWQEVFSVSMTVAMITAFIDAVLIMGCLLNFYVKRKLPWNARKKCCARCGVDLSIISVGKIKTIDGKLYCDVCEKAVLHEASNRVATKPAAQIQTIPSISQSKPAAQIQTNPSISQHTVCVRCKRAILESQAVWIGNHRFCQECAQPLDSGPNHKKKQAQMLVNALVQVEIRKKEELLYGVCSVCKRKFADETLIYVDGICYCEDCFGITFNRDKEEKPCSETEWHQVSYEIGGVVNQSLLSQLTNVVDCLIAGGFEFYRASVGGGADATTRSNAVSYTHYDMFQKNMESDWARREREQEREQEKYEKSGGRVHASDYFHVCAFLARNTLKVYVVAEPGRIILRWLDNSDKAFAATRVFAERVIEDVYDHACTLKQIDNMELNGDFLSNWS